MRDPMDLWLERLTALDLPATAVHPGTGASLPAVWLELIGGDAPGRLTVDWTVRVHCLAASGREALRTAVQVRGAVLAFPGTGAAAYASAGAPAVEPDPDTEAVDAAFTCTLTSLRGPLNA